MTTKIYHNPQCSKSRATLALLEEQGVTLTIVRYLETPPSRAELVLVLEALNLSPRDLMRTGEQVYRDLELGAGGLSDDALIDAMISNPILIERPIVLHGDKAAIGRPPESVLDIL